MLTDKNRRKNSLVNQEPRSERSSRCCIVEGMINWVLQLNNSQSGNSFNSLLEKHHVSIFPNQPNPNPIQSVIDRGNVIAQKMCLLLKEKNVPFPRDR